MAHLADAEAPERKFLLKDEIFVAYVDKYPY